MAILRRLRGGIHVAETVLTAFNIMSAGSEDIVLHRQKTHIKSTSILRLTFYIWYDEKLLLTEHLTRDTVHAHVCKIRLPHMPTHNTIVLPIGDSINTN